MTLFKTNSEYRLDDSVISEISKTLQMAILTGTDIVDNLRMIRLVESSEKNTLVLTQEYKNMIDKNIEKMLERTEKMKEDVLSDE